MTRERNSYGSRFDLIAEMGDANLESNSIQVDFAGTRF